MIGIYKITNIKNNMLYIGSSNNIERRIQQHIYLLIDNKHYNLYLQNAYNKYGKDSFKFEVIKTYENISKEELLENEQKVIDSYSFEELYNLNPLTRKGGSGGARYKQPCFLLDLRGNILETFNSIGEACEFLGYTYRHLPLSSINNPSICKKKYRIVTKEFYKNELELILSWRKYKNKKDKYLNYYKFDEITRKYIVFDGDDIIARTEDENLAMRISKTYVESINE